MNEICIEQTQVASDGKVAKINAMNKIYKMMWIINASD